MMRTRLLLPLAVVWIIAVLLSYHAPPPSGEWFSPGPLLSLLCDLSLLTFIALAAWGLGAALLRPLRLEEDSPWEAHLFEIGAGLGTLSLLVLALAAVRLLYAPIVAALLAGSCLLLAGPLWRTLVRPPVPSVAYPERWSWAEIWLGALVVIAAVPTLVCSLAPAEFYDALIYHLAVPDLYIREHGIVRVTGNHYAGFPANMGMLYAIGLLLRGPQLAQSIHWLCGAAAGAALFRLGTRHAGRRTALLATAMFALTPAVMVTSTWAIADLGVTLFGTLCFAAVLNLWSGGDRRWLAAAGLFAGLALGTKYTAAIVVCAPAAAAVAIRPGRGSRTALDALRLAAIVLAVASPWLLRNAVLEGNPFAPYLSGGGGTGSPDILDEMGRRLPREAGVTGLLTHYLAAPWNVSMKRLGAGGYAGPLFLMLVPLLAFLRGLPRVVAPAALICAVALAGWAVTTQVTRYLLPVLPLVALLAAVSAMRLPRWLSVPAAGWPLLYGLLLFTLLMETTGALRVVSGAETKEDYLARRVSYYRAAVFLESSPPDATVLMIGEGRGFYVPRDYVASTPLDHPSALERYARRAAEAGESLVAVLRADGITHLLVSDPELRRTRNVTADEVMRRYFPAGAPLLFESPGVRVYGLPR